MNNDKTIRFSYFIGFILIGILFGLAFYLQTHEGIIPCPLCILQRFTFGILGVIFLLGAIIKRKCAHLFLASLGLIVTVAGILFSGRQVWLQHMPSEGLGGCGVSLEYLYKIYSLPDVILRIWQGGIECSERAWEFLHLSLAEWSLVWFAVFFLVMIVQMRRISQKTEKARTI